MRRRAALCPVAVVTAAILACELAGYGAASEGAIGAPAYGFRYDPMAWVDGDTSAQAALVRREVFGEPADVDDGIVERRIEEILAAQNQDGTLSDDPRHRMQFTAERLIELAELGVAAEQPDVARAVDVLLRERTDEGSDTLGVHALRALCMLGRIESPKVVAGLRALMERADEWNRPDKGCPWTPAAHLQTLWAGRALVDVDALLTDALAWIAESMNAAGCITYKDPMGFVRMAGMVNHPLAARIVRQEMPFILRAQRPDGGWGESSFAVYRALVNHELFDESAALPAAPPDWRVVRSLPTPTSSIRGMEFAAGLLWLWEPEADELIALSPDGGDVVRRMPVDVDYVYGLTWRDGEFVLSQSRDPKRLIFVSEATGELTRELRLEEMHDVGDVAVVGDEIWVSDRWMPSIRAIRIDNADERRWLNLAGPGAASLAVTDDGVWHADFWAHGLIKSDFHGRLLDVADKPPFEPSSIAWDGEHLWVFDAENQRVCMIERLTR